MSVTSATPGRFGALLREFRLRAGLTQQELADLSALSVRALRDLEAGRVRQPRRDTVRLLAAALRLEGEREERFTQAGHSTPRNPAPPPGRPEVHGGLVGREAELDALVHRLLQLGPGRLAVTGLPGVGKTRLVAAAVERLHRDHGRAVVWSTAAEGTGVDADAADLDASPHTGTRPTLVVVDGADTADRRPSAAAPARLRLRHAPATVVETRRAPSGLPGEESMPLAPFPVLTAPGAVDPWRLLSQPAARIFVSRARLSHSGYAPSPADAERLAELCSLLDGLPRALEQAADWCLVHALRDLLDWAREDPLGLAGESLAAELTAAIAELPRRQRELLELMAAGERAWTLTSLAPVAARPRADLARDLHALALRGLLLSWPPQEPHGFRVPRLVAHALAAAAGTAAGLPVELPGAPGTCA